jgi:fatty acid desaturase
LIIITFLSIGVAIRQVDRWWFSPRRKGWALRLCMPSFNSMGDLIAIQRQRRNDYSPILLLFGHWMEIVGLWLLGARFGLLAWPLVSLLIAIKYRHLQEVSHYAIHGSLTRTRVFGDMLIEIAAHAPLALPAVSTRRRTHVRLHHPNATKFGVDPNLGDLSSAGMRPGCTRSDFVRSVVFPLTASGMANTLKVVRLNLEVRPNICWRLPMTFAVVFCLACVDVINGPIFGLLVPRLAIYPMLAWFSLLAEHVWFPTNSGISNPGSVEAARCLRLYVGRPGWEILARVSWLPYGDLFHFAHSLHPSIRWNYLPLVEGIAGLPTSLYRQFLVGTDSVVGTLYAATRSVGSDVRSSIMTA